MNRRRFLKLLAAVPLVMGLRLPVSENESETVVSKKWHEARERFFVYRSDLTRKKRAEHKDGPRTIYVAESGGDDCNDGLSPLTPKRTVAADGTVDGEADFMTFIVNGVRINWGNAPGSILIGDCIYGA